ncbi:hypothetical protein [Edaphobacter modestus]|uniref:Lipoprotein n=1 Tax=Edaphobacter modestus TaxID=388466 RepID=A0A4Q7YQY0_9BACT|nr:hypothetical protein [Edaphobacter modestus]RZU39303.1 hypothetical protein BDD14_0672 [Edaphobacter modestus]
MKIAIGCALVFGALLALSVACGRWLARISEEFEEAENHENE